MWKKYFDILIEKIVTWTELVTANLPNLLISLIVVILFYFISKVTSRLAKKIFLKTTHANALSGIAASSIKIATLCMGLILALGVLGLQKTVFSLLAGVGVLGLALGFAFQDLAANFIAGLIMAFRRPFENGHVIESNGYMGTVKKLNLRNTIIEDFFGQYIFIPNKEVFENPLKNFSYKNKRRIDLKVGVAYGSDLEKVIQVSEQTINSLNFILKDEEIDIWAEEFAGSSINFSIRFWIQYPGEPSYPLALSKAIIAIKKSYDEANIEIPFPIRTIDFPQLEKSIKVAPNS